VQHEKIAAWASLRGVEIAEWHTDLDETGGKADRPGLQAALKRIQAGDTEGIVVAKMDRLSRLHVGDALGLVAHIADDLGGTVVAIDIDLDPTTPTGEMVWTNMLALGRWERRRIAESWAEASQRAVKDGVHISAAPPTGYLRENGKRSRLVPDPTVAPLVRECFLRRAKGASWQEIATYMCDHGVRLSKSGAARIVHNRVYLGEARGPKAKPNKAAHTPLVTVQEWEAAQWQGRRHARDGTVAAQGLLSGLITCAGCGHKLSVTGGRKTPDGGNVPVYFCKSRYSGGNCPAPAAARVSFVDDFVIQALGEAATDGTLSATLDAISRYRRATDAVAKAEGDLHEIEEDTELVAALGVRGVAKLATKQRAVLDEAKRVLRETPTPADAIEPDQSFWFEPETWPMDEKRRLAKQLIASVTLSRSGRGRYRPPVSTRLEITWAGHAEPDHTIAERVKRTAGLPGP